MHRSKRKIAILGAGGAGVCAALELARRGYKIDLYERCSLPVSKASYVNEGKVHLGFVYAMDSDFYTAKKMIVGALHFVSNLKRWIDLDPEDVISTPFIYGVHNDSLMNASGLLHHYKRCASVFDEAAKHFNRKYLDLFDSVQVQRMSAVALEKICNPEYIQAGFATNEYSVEPRTIAKKLREALSNEPAIQLLLNTTVEKVTRVGSKLMVHAYDSGDDQVLNEKYTDVINTAWAGRLTIDKSMGILPKESWSFRYKFGNKIFIPLSYDDVPSVTMVQGPFGDTVNFKDKGLFLSWYPIGRTGWSEEYSPPDWDEELTVDQRKDIFWRSFEQMKLRIPSVNSLEFRSEDIDWAGGVIYAIGNQDVDKAGSKLHARYHTGITSYDNYHTVNTGKYTLIPYLGVKIADRIEGIE